MRRHDAADTPANYSGAALKFVRVNAGATALEFHVPVLGDSSDFPTYSIATAAMLLRTKVDGSGLEWISPAGASAPALTDLTDVDNTTPATDKQIIYWDNTAGKWKYRDDTFLALKDTPAAYTGKGGQYAVVNSTEDGLVFAQGVSGAFSIDYSFSTTTTDADPGNGNLRVSNATQNLSTVIRADLLDKYGSDWSAALATLADSTNTVKGYLRLYNKVDPTKFIFFTVSALASPAGYKNITVVEVASSTASPFAGLDVVTLEFTLAGDKGATGATGATGAGAASFTALTDAPANYTSAGRKTVRVNAAANALEFIDAPYTLAFYQEPIMTNAQIVYKFIATVPFTLPSGLSGSYANAEVASTGNVHFDIRKNGSDVGDIVFNISATGSFTLGSDQSFAAGDILTITGPATADATLAGVATSLKGYLT